MKPPLKRFCAAALALSLLFLSGCAGGGDAPSARAMGRYVETRLELPADFAYLLGLHRAGDGSLELLGFPNATDGSHHIYLHAYRSTDGGVTWTEEQHAWIDDFNRDDNPYFPQAAAWGPDGTLYLNLASYENETGTDQFARLDGDDLVFYDGGIPAASDGSGLRSFLVAESGDFLLDCFSEFLQVDPETGSVKHVYTAPTADGGGWNDGFALTGNTLAVSEAGRIVFYDLTTGKETGAISCQGSTGGTYSSNLYRVMDYGADGTLSFADPKGIYRAAQGSDTLERLADGSLTTLSVPSVARMALFAMENGRYLALCWSNQEYLLYAYQYDPDMPTLPAAELTVYSLEEDPLIQQAIAALQTSDPGVHVTYQVGVPEDGSVTREDAIRALNTQLLAGKGPDLLVMDGLPLASYLEKNVLADLTGRLEGMEGLLTSVTSSLRRSDGAVYAVPAQFQVPMLHGSDEAMAAIHDLASLTDWLEANKSDFRTPFFFDTTKDYLRFLYPACAAALRGHDGRTDQEKLAEFLALVKRIADLRTDPDEAESENGSSIAFDFGPLGWMAGYNALDGGNLVHFQGLYAAWSASDKAGTGSSGTLFGQNAFLPVTVLGISAQSRQQDLAWRFLQTALSDEVQGAAVGKGIPVSAAAFDASTRENKDRNNGVFSTYGTAFSDAEGATVPVTMQVLYPPEAYRQAMAERIKALDTPLLYDEAVLQLLLDNTVDFFAGRAGLDATVDRFMGKLKLYEAE